jgi:hypothetical protein
MSVSRQRAVENVRAAAAYDDVVQFVAGAMKLPRPVNVRFSTSCPSV